MYLSNVASAGEMDGSVPMTSYTVDLRKHLNLAVKLYPALSHAQLEV